LGGDYTLQADRDEAGDNRNSGQAKTETGRELIWTDRNAEPDEPKYILTDALADTFSFTGVPIQQEVAAKDDEHTGTDIICRLTDCLCDLGTKHQADQHRADLAAGQHK
jgi:hypothetical protein